MPKKVGTCFKRALPRKAVKALGLPVGDAKLWSEIATKATEKYQQTPKRNDMKRWKTITRLGLIAKLQGVLGAQGVIGAVLNGRITTTNIVIIVLFIVLSAAKFFSEKLRKENYVESQKAVEEYVKGELTKSLAKQGLYCMYALEERKKAALSLESMGWGSAVKAPVIFIDSKPFTKNKLLLAAEKLCAGTQLATDIQLAATEVATEV